MEAGANEQADVRTVFGTFDTDDDWMLDVHEFGRALARLTWHGRSPEEVERLFLRADVDGDGLLTLPEFEECVAGLQHP
ncbi:EF-hand domain-containing protein [Streptomyces sp. NPDC048603]|uniref:EF-hand domain-containing protein n=1 Tax=Streptomyces sp. NPDC048603 TaxID=3365577 RepID=UPI00371FEB43